MYDFNIKGAFWAVGIFGALIVGIIWLIFWLISSNDIKSSQPITPEIVIDVVEKDGEVVKADTTYIYRKP